MPVPEIAPLRKRLCLLRCRLSYAQQRIRELEALLTLHRVAIPPGVTEVPPVSHDCFEPAGNVIYCRGCQRIWVERSVSIVALASGVVPADCACTCTDPADPLYETWMVNPDEDDLPEGVWVS